MKIVQKSNSCTFCRMEVQDSEAQEDLKKQICFYMWIIQTVLVHLVWNLLNQCCIVVFL